MPITVDERKQYLYQDLTYAVIGAAMEVHRALGPGYLEAVYQRALEIELGIRGINYCSQQPLTVTYKNRCVGEYIPDFLVEEKLIVEIKAINSVTKSEEAQLINYLAASGCKVGLLLNFGARSLEHIRRVL